MVNLREGYRNWDHRRRRAVATGDRRPAGGGWDMICMRTRGVSRVAPGVMCHSSSLSECRHRRSDPDVPMCSPFWSVTAAVLTYRSVAALSSDVWFSPVCRGFQGQAEQQAGASRPILQGGPVGETQQHEDAPCHPITQSRSVLQRSRVKSGQ